MYNSLEDRALKSGIINPSTGYCQKCGATLDRTQYTIDPPSKYYEAITVCEDCHSKIENGTMKAFASKEDLERDAVKHAASDAYHGNVQTLTNCKAGGVSLIIMGILLFAIGIIFPFVMILGMIFIVMGIALLAFGQYKFNEANKRQAVLSRERTDVMETTQGQIVENTAVPAAVFATATNTSKSALDRINELDCLLKNGLITKEDFDKRKEKILDEI